MAAQTREIELDVEIEEYEETGKNLFQKVAGLMRSSLMVGVGTADYAREKFVKGWEKAGEVTHGMAERGEKVTEERRGQIGDQVEKRQEQIKELGEKAGGSFEKYSEAVLTRVNMPTAEDIEDLSKQVGALSRKLDKVRKDQQEMAA
jgi:polyhydroxyalkanoate synthesis regulator phasin